jgi:predicted RNA binding protein YcfA (HicA-like mRNA interferase family)
MTRLPSVTGAEAVRVLERAGLVIVRISGSHHRLVHPADPTRATTVPVHGAKALKSGTLRGIIKQAGLTVDEFRNLL